MTIPRLLFAALPAKLFLMLPRIVPSCLAVLPLAFAAFPLAAEVAYLNANVLSMDRSKPTAEAMLVGGNRFAAVGSNAEIRRRMPAGTQVVDLKGQTVVPGFNDVHLHPRPQFGEDSPYWTPWLGPDRVRTIDDLVATLRKKSARTAPGQPVSGIGYQDTKLGRHPTRADLDRVSTEHPVAITHSSGHITAVNSYVLRAAGITRQTADPAGGAFDRDAAGEPNGVVRESARRLLRASAGPDLLASQGEIPEGARVEGLVRAFAEYAARGLTSVSAAGVSPDMVRLLQLARRAGNPVRTGVMLTETHFAAASGLGLFAGFGDAGLRLTAIKSFHGNSLSGRTCWLSEEYSDRPGYFGIPPARGQEELDRAIAAMHNAGWQIAVHSNGDREIDMLLTAFERAQSHNPRPDPRHRIEHASVMTRPLLERARKLGLILVFHSYMWEHGDKLEAYGPKRLEMMHAYRTALDMGIHVAGHSDAPVSAAYPLLRIQDMVTRRSENGKVYGGSQRITVEEALRVFTADGAYATFEEKDKGAIAAGMLADFVVLGEDPRRVDPQRIKDIAVRQVYIGGELVSGQR